MTAMFGDNIEPPQFQIRSKEELFEDCLDQIKDWVSNLKPGQSIAIKREKNTDNPSAPIFTVYTKGTIELNRGGE